MSAVIGLAACLAWTPPAAAADRTFTLYGRDNAPAGWGPDPGNITNPGPHLEVNLGDNVILNLNGIDGTNLRWFIDYDNDTNDDANEPNSPSFDFGGLGPVTWNFTADRPGTFWYRSSFHPNTMTGTMTIQNVTGFQLPTPNLDALMFAAILVGAFVAIIAVAALVSRRKQDRRA